MAIDERVARLERSMQAFEDAYPDIIRALEVLGVRVDDYEQGMTTAITGPVAIVSDTTSPRAAGDDQFRRP